LAPVVFSVADGTLNIPRLTRPLLIRPSQGSTFGATCLARNCPNPERADLFIARTAAEGLRVGST
jgi:hypothetical protein